MTPNEKFERDGFVVVRNFFGSEEISAINTALARFIREYLHKLRPEDVFFEDKAEQKTLKQIQQLQKHDSFFSKLFENKPRLLAEQLLGENVIGKNLQYFNKPPGRNQATPPHQDGQYFMLKPCHAVTLWLALDDTDEENGCVRYVCGSHKHGLRPHKRTQTLGFSQGITDFGLPEDITNEVPCPARPGDILAHHALTIHRANANNSKYRTRRALGFIFYAKSACENFKAHKRYQDHLTNELAQAGKI